MKILYLIDQTYLHGGIEKVLMQKANYFSDILNDDVTIITYNQKNKKSCYSFSHKITFIDLGINYKEGISYFHPFHLKKIIRHYVVLQNTLRDLQPEIIVSSSFGPDFYFIPFIEKHIPKIKEFHSSRYFYTSKIKTFKTKSLNRLSNFTKNRYHQLVLLNDSELSFFDGENISVIPNPADISGEKANVFSKKIIAAGRIAPLKNFGDLIESFSRLSVRFPDWELHFFGEDYLGTQEVLQEKINQLGLKKKIKFKGSIPNLKKGMQNYSIYAMTSETECFPMVLLEALSVGMPIVSYDSPTGPKHILTNNEDSFLVPYKNLDIFVEKLEELMQNENLRQKMGQKGLENAQRFSIEKVMHQWKDLFTSLTTKTSNI